jgi:hypothetical protein
MNIFQVLVLRVHLFAHGATQVIESLGGTVQSIQVGVDLVLPLIVIGVGFELELRSIGKS